MSVTASSGSPRTPRVVRTPPGINTTLINIYQTPRHGRQSLLQVTSSIHTHACCWCRRNDWVRWEHRPGCSCRPPHRKDRVVLDQLVSTGYVDDDHWIVDPQIVWIVDNDIPPDPMVECIWFPASLIEEGSAPGPGCHVETGTTTCLKKTRFPREIIFHKVSLFVGYKHGLWPGNYQFFVLPVRELGCRNFLQTCRTPVKVLSPTELF